MSFANFVANTVAAQQLRQHLANLAAGGPAPPPAPSGFDLGAVAPLTQGLGGPLPAPPPIPAPPPGALQALASISPALAGKAVTQLAAQQAPPAPMPPGGCPPGTSAQYDAATNSFRCVATAGAPATEGGLPVHQLHGLDPATLAMAMAPPQPGSGAMANVPANPATGTPQIPGAGAAQIPAPVAVAPNPFPQGTPANPSPGILEHQAPGPLAASPALTSPSGAPLPPPPTAQHPGLNPVGEALTSQPGMEHGGGPPQNPINAGLGAVVGAAGRLATEALNAPQKYVEDQYGELVYQEVRGAQTTSPGVLRTIADMVITGPGQDAQQVEAQIVAAHDDGYTPLTGAYKGQKVYGGRAVHELEMDKIDAATAALPAPLAVPLRIAFKATFATIENPLTYVGAVGRIGDLLSTIGEAGVGSEATGLGGAIDQVLGRAAQGMGAGLKAPAQALEAASQVPKVAAQTVVNAVEGLPVVGPLLEKALAVSPRQTARNIYNEVRGALDEATGRVHVPIEPEPAPPGEPLPAPPTPTDLAPGRVVQPGLAGMPPPVVAAPPGEPLPVPPPAERAPLLEAIAPPVEAAPPPPPSDALPAAVANALAEAPPPPAGEALVAETPPPASPPAAFKAVRAGARWAVKEVESGDRVEGMTFRTQAEAESFARQLEPPAPAGEPLAAETPPPASPAPPARAVEQPTPAVGRELPTPAQTPLPLVARDNGPRLIDQIATRDRAAYDAIVADPAVRREVADAWAQMRLRGKDALPAVDQAIQEGRIAAAIREGATRAGYDASDIPWSRHFETTPTVIDGLDREGRELPAEAQKRLAATGYTRTQLPDGRVQWSRPAPAAAVEDLIHGPDATAPEAAPIRQGLYAQGTIRQPNGLPAPGDVPAVDRYNTIMDLNWRITAPGEVQAPPVPGVAAADLGALPAPTLGVDATAVGPEPVPDTTAPTTADFATARTAATAPAPAARPPAFRHPISDEAAATLGRQIAGGPDADQTVYQKFARTLGEAQRDQLIAQPLLERARLSASDVAGMSVRALDQRTPLSLDEATRLKGLVTTYARYGDIGTANPELLAKEMAARDIATGESGFVAKRPSVWSDIVLGLPRDMLHDPTNWTYTTANAVGDELSWKIAYPEAQSPTMYQGGPRAILGAAKAAFGRQVDDLPSVQAWDRLGLGGTPADIADSVNKLGESGTYSSAVRRLVSRVNGDVGAVLGKPFEVKAGIDQNLEGLRRAGASAERLGVRVQEAAPQLTRDLQTYVANRPSLGIAADDIAQTVAELPTYRGVFGPGDVHAALVHLGQERGVEGDALANFADRGARTWTNLARGARDQALDDVRSPFGIGQERNADVLLGKVMAFHTWQSRITPTLLEEGIRNPILISSFVQAQDGIDRMAKEGDFPKAVTSWLRVLSGPLGLSVYVNPANLAIVNNLWDRSNGGDTARHLTLLGSVRDALQNYGVGTWPMIDTLINLTGAFGDAHLSPPVSFPAVRLGQKVADAVLSQLDPGLGPLDHAYSQALQDARQTLSSALGNEVPATNENLSSHDLIASQIASDHPDWTTGQVNAAAWDTGNPAEQAAWQKVAASGALTQLWNQTMPLRVAVRNVARDAAMAGNTRANADIAAGTPVPPADQAAKQMRQVETAGSPQAGALQADAAEWRGLGSPDGQQAVVLWDNAAYGTPTAPVTVGGVTLTPQQVASMDAATRRQLADAVVNQAGLGAQLQAQRQAESAYKTAHPEFAAYKTFQKDAASYPGGVDAWWQQTIKANPNAARWYQSQIVDAGLTGGDPATLAHRQALEMGVGGYLAYAGLQQSVYDVAPTSVRDPSKIPYSATEGLGGAAAPATPAPQTPGQILQGQLDSYYNRMAQANAVLSQVEGTPTNFQHLAPFWQQAYQAWYPGMVPIATGAVVNYMKWVRGQPQGNDVSIPTFVAAFEQGRLDHATEQATQAAIGNPYAVPYDVTDIANPTQRPDLLPAVKGGRKG